MNVNERQAEHMAEQARRSREANIAALAELNGDEWELLEQVVNAPYGVYDYNCSTEDAGRLREFFHRGLVWATRTPASAEERIAYGQSYVTLYQGKATIGDLMAGPIRPE